MSGEDPSREKSQECTIFKQNDGFDIVTDLSNAKLTQGDHNILYVMYHMLPQRWKAAIEKLSKIDEATKVKRKISTAEGFREELRDVAEIHGLGLPIYHHNSLGDEIGSENRSMENLSLYAQLSIASADHKWQRDLIGNAVKEMKL